MLSSRARANRYLRSSVFSFKALVIDSKTKEETLTSLPCSSHVYQVVLMLASCATSSRLRPGVLLRVPSGIPTV